MITIAILGGGESGVGAALLAQQRGYSPFVSDERYVTAERRATLQEANIPFEEGKHSLDLLKQADRVVVSPGISPEAPVVQALRQAGKELIDEIAFATPYLQAPVIAITGSNGKTTTAHLVHHLLRVHGYDVRLVGNVGHSLAREVATASSPDYYVLELSSAQLAVQRVLRPYIAALLNITPDHLDRHGTMDAYIASKFRVAQHMRSSDHLIYNADDSVLCAALPQMGGTPTMHPVSLRYKVKCGMYCDNVNFYSTLPRYTLQLPRAAFPLLGPHNAYNALVALTIAGLLRVASTTLERALNSFRGIPHRLEEIITYRGVTFYNDSKATNTAAACTALASFTRPIVWIAGGQDKGNDYTELLPLVRDKVKALICLCVDDRTFMKYFQTMVPVCYTTHDVDEAVQLAYAASAPGDVILLAPACASFDLFDHFAQRGDLFKAAVQRHIARVNVAT